MGDLGHPRKETASKGDVYSIDESTRIKTQIDVLLVVNEINSEKVA
jgi:aspartate-semialdehyde dehydrogenase